MIFYEVINIGTQITNEIEVTIDGMFLHVLENLFVKEKAGELLHAVVAQFSFAAAEKNNHGALEQAVEIDDEIIFYLSDCRNK